MPDIATISQTQIPTQNKPIAGPPKWLIEILSPDQSTTTLIAKIQTCINEGSQLGWLLDSQEAVIMFFSPRNRFRLSAATSSHRF